jgi:hypothetical protein
MHRKNTPEERIAEICIILIVGYLALIAPLIFVPVLVGMLIANK